MPERIQRRRTNDPQEPVEMTAWRVSGLAKGDWP